MSTKPTSITSKNKNSLDTNKNQTSEIDIKSEHSGWIIKENKDMKEEEEKDSSSIISLPKKTTHLIEKKRKRDDDDNNKDYILRLIEAQEKIIESNEKKIKLMKEHNLIEFLKINPDDITDTNQFALFELQQQRFLQEKQEEEKNSS